MICLYKLFSRNITATIISQTVVNGLIQTWPILICCVVVLCCLFYNYEFIYWLNYRLLRQSEISTRFVETVHHPHKGSRAEVSGDLPGCWLWYNILAVALNWIATNHLLWSWFSSSYIQKMSLHKVALFTSSSCM